MSQWQVQFTGYNSCWLIVSDKHFNLDNCPHQEWRFFRRRASEGRGVYVFCLPVACKYPRCQFGQQCVEVCTNQIPWRWNYFYCHLEAAVKRENNKQNYPLSSKQRRQQGAFIGFSVYRFTVSVPLDKLMGSLILGMGLGRCCVEMHCGTVVGIPTLPLLAIVKLHRINLGRSSSP